MADDDPRLAELERLYRLRFQHFLRVAMAITGDHESALDAVQDGFGDAIRSRATFRGRGAFEAWVWRAVVNAARDQRSGQPASAPPEVPATSNGAPSRWPALRVAVAELPERQRLVVFLRYYADLDYRAIGEALGIRTGTVSAALHAAHRSLRKALTEEVRT